MIRIDQLTTPPVPGKYYLVACVLGNWLGRSRWWPVMGSLHEDAKFFHFPYQHYHLDRRFLRSEKDVGRSVRFPLHGPLAGFKPIVELSAPRWRPRKCYRAEAGFPDWALVSTRVTALQAALAGAQCQHDETGWICSHRGFRLGSIAALDGIILCPLHGLQIEAATGRVVAGGRLELRDEATGGAP